MLLSFIWLGKENDMRELFARNIGRCITHTNKEAYEMNPLKQVRETGRENILSRERERESKRVIKIYERDRECRGKCRVYG